MILLDYSQIALSNIINISPGDIVLKENESKEDVITKFFNDDEWEYYPDKNNYHSKIFKCADPGNKIKNLKGFLVNVKDHSEPQFKECFQFSLNLYVINFGIHEVKIHWIYDNKKHEKIVQPFDSLSIDPYVEFVFTASNDENRLFLVTSDTAISLETKIELSFFKDAYKTITDDEQWFEGKKGE